MRDPAATFRQVLPSEARAAFSDRLVRFHLDELNGLSDQFNLHPGQEDSEAARTRAIASSRCEELLEALSWNHAEVVRLVWSRLDRAPEREEDLVGPALVLRALSRNRAQYRVWARGLSTEVRRRLATTLRDCCTHALRESAFYKASAGKQGQEVMEGRLRIDLGRFGVVKPPRGK
jgi:hypothetical protein